MKAAELIFKRKNGKWVFREPGYIRVDGGYCGIPERIIERVPHQDFEYDSEKEALGHAHWYLNPPREWFPPPPA